MLNTTSLRFLLAKPSCHDSGSYYKYLSDALQSLGYAAYTSIVTTSAEISTMLEQTADGSVVLVDGALLNFLENLTQQQLAKLVLLMHDPEILNCVYIIMNERKNLSLLHVAKVVATNVALSEDLARNHAVSPDRLCVVTPGVTRYARPAIISAGKIAENAGMACCQLLSIGRIAPQSGHDRLVQTLSRLPDLDWKLTIAGTSVTDTAHLAALQRVIHTTAVADRVTLVEQPDFEETELLWHKVDVFVSAALDEGQDSSVREAFSRGVPVAVTSGECRAIDGAGAVCKPDDLDGLSKSLRRMIFDQSLRARMAEAAWQAGQRLPSWQDQAYRLLDCLTF